MDKTMVAMLRVEMKMRDIAKREFIKCSVYLLGSIMNTEKSKRCLPSFYFR